MPLALLHGMDAHAYLQPTPGHRDALFAHADHVIRLICIGHAGLTR
jgi:hypothetical protein